MNYFKVSALFCGLLFGSCCHQYSPKSSDPADTKEMQPAKLMKDRDEKLSPGTAKVICTLTNLPDNSSNLLVRIKSVSGYGMSTKPITPGMEMEIFISDEQRNILKRIKLGEELDLIISQEQRIQSKDVYWTVIDIIE